ncbi:hypothetical protein [Comamonas serinivorans]|uniref:hypothetical protein n=1 Tax=Comamonas serinivorans TaxID=1082851 RepID=UPI0012FCAD3F|nr:hypothetical protein [Comamonas serinivorans]
MAATPPQGWPHVSEPTDRQLKRAQRIASKTGKTVEQVLAAAIARGASAQMTELLTQGARKTH